MVTNSHAAIGKVCPTSRFEKPMLQNQGLQRAKPSKIVKNRRQLRKTG
jgi:hypothetical protein